MIVNRVQVTVEPWSFASTSERELRIKVEVDGKEPLFIQHILLPDDIEAWLDRYFEAALYELKKALAAIDADGERARGKGDVATRDAGAKRGGGKDE